MRNNTKIITTTALMSAIIFISTYIGTALPFSGYVHLGDAAVFLAGLILGPHYGLVAASLGSALADGIKGYIIYIPSTIVLKGIMAFLAGKVRNKNSKIKIPVCIASGLIMVAGYYITEIIIYSNLISPLSNIPWNILQFIIGLVVAFIMIKPLKKIVIK